MIKKSLYNNIDIPTIKRIVAITHPCYPTTAKHYFQGYRVTPGYTLVTGGGVTSFYTLIYMISLGITPYIDIQFFFKGCNPCNPVTYIYTAIVFLVTPIPLEHVTTVTQKLPDSVFKNTHIQPPCNPVTTEA